MRHEQRSPTSRVGREPVDSRARRVGSMRVACVLPVRGRPDLLAGCLEALRGQDTPVDEIIVVDDSPGASLGGIEGVRILHSSGRGPYAARNLGWRATGADVVLFLDGRSRPRPEWARRVAELFQDPGVALAGSDVLTRGGASLGARAGQRHQFFKLSKYLDSGLSHPYLPSCNLAVRREDLLAVDGFREIRSGADADLCWRIQSRSGRRLVADPDVLMEWVPRDRVLDYLSQSYRYGKSNRALRRAWRAEGVPQMDPVSHRRLTRRAAGVAGRTTLRVAQRRPDDVVREVRKAGDLARRFGYRVATDREHVARLPEALGRHVSRSSVSRLWARVACPCCGARFRRFASGMGHPNRQCPECGSLERHRQLALLFDRRDELLRPGLRILHMAPERALAQLIEKACPSTYLTADLEGPGVDMRFDLTEVPLAEDSFDAVLCNHVMEHIPNDRAALREIRRILAPGGWALVMTPILVETTIEDPSLTDPAERLRRFGQDDHVRRYGWDYVDRLREAGFEVDVIRLEDELSEAEVDRYRLRNNEEIVEPIFLVS